MFFYISLKSILKTLTIDTQFVSIHRSSHFPCSWEAVGTSELPHTHLAAITTVLLLFFFFFLSFLCAVFTFPKRDWITFIECNPFFSHIVWVRILFPVKLKKIKPQVLCRFHFTYVKDILIVTRKLVIWMKEDDEKKMKWQKCKLSSPFFKRRYFTLKSYSQPNEVGVVSKAPPILRVKGVRLLQFIRTILLYAGRSAFHSRKVT